MSISLSSSSSSPSSPSSSSSLVVVVKAGSDRTGYNKRAQQRRAKEEPALCFFSLIFLIFSLFFFAASSFSFFLGLSLHRINLARRVKVLNQKAGIRLREDAAKVVTFTCKKAALLLDEVGQREDAAARVLALVVGGTPRLVDDLALGDDDVQGRDIVLSLVGDVDLDLVHRAPVALPGVLFFWETAEVGDVFFFFFFPSEAF